jgi:mRNA interferase RelE/StbE
VTSGRYRIEFAPSAARAFEALSAEAQRRLRPRINALATEPRPPGVKKLKVETPRYRIRVGEYRVVYEIRDRILLVIVLVIGHRKDVYRRNRPT